MDTEPYPVVAGLLIRKAVTWYGTVPDRRGTIHTESGHVVNSVSHTEYVVL